MSTTNWLSWLPPAAKPRLDAAPKPQEAAIEAEVGNGSNDSNPNGVASASQGVVVGTWFNVAGRRRSSIHAVDATPLGLRPLHAGIPG